MNIMRFSRKNKVKKSHGAAFYVIGTFTLAIESMLGINAAFLVDQSIAIVAKNMLDGTPLASLASIIPLLVSLAVGFCFVAGGLWAFSGFMDSLDDARAYIEEYDSGKWPVRLVWALIIAIVALDLTTLVFRAAYFAEKGAAALLFFFLILIFLPPILGSLVHVLENTPRERQLAKVRTNAVVQESQRAAHILEAMDADLQTRWINGDRDGACKEHYERVEADLKEERLYKQQQQEAKERGKQKKLYGNTTRPLAAASLAQQADERS
jgi:hypothetical protein